MAATSLQAATMALAAELNSQENPCACTQWKAVCRVTWKHNPILPTDPYEKAMARFWAKYIDDKQKKVVVSKGEEQKGVIEEIQEQLKTLESELKETKF
ncbi:hypothetical protein AAG906_032586 [Vitis piasezkii]